MERGNQFCDPTKLLLMPIKHINPAIMVVLFLLMSVRILAETAVVIRFHLVCFALDSAWTPSQYGYKSLLRIHLAITVKIKKCCTQVICLE